MTLLLTGIVLFAALHFIPSLAPGLKQAIQGRVGEIAYKGIFALANLAALTLVTRNWGSTEVWQVYEPPQWGRAVTGVLVLAAFLLFAFSIFKTNVKRFVRHPQLTAVVVWAIGHLLANGNNFSLAVFGGLGLWALVQMALINRRLGGWQKPDRVPISAEILPVVVGLVAYAGFLYAHEYLIGVSLFS